MAIFSRFSSIRSAIVVSSPARSPTLVFPHACAAPSAASRAFSTSSAVPRATSVNVCPVTVVGFSKYRPFAGATYSPPMKWSYRGL
jgi:hypothetical protein